MKSSDENTTSNGRSALRGTRLSVVSPQTKTASEKPTAATKVAESKNGSSPPGSVTGSGSSSPSRRQRKTPCPPKEVDRQADALKRLKVKTTDLEKAPEITPLFRSMAVGGLKTVLKAMRFAHDDEVIAGFLKKYDSIPVGDRERLPWEAIALSARVNIQHLTGSTLLAIQSYSQNAVRVLALTAHPAVMRKRIQYAKLPSGEKDRNALDQGLGFLPSPKGPTFIGRLEVGRVPNRREIEVEPPEPMQATAMPIFTEDDDIDQLFPPASLVQDKLVAIRQRLLDKGGE